jgi:hypothetical protein
MVSVQLGVSIEDALFELETRAALESRSVVELATAVIERRYRFGS